MSFLVLCSQSLAYTLERIRQVLIRRSYLSDPAFRAESSKCSTCTCPLAQTSLDSTVLVHVHVLVSCAFLASSGQRVKVARQSPGMIQVHKYRLVQPLAHTSSCILGRQASRSPILDITKLRRPLRSLLMH